MTEVQIKSEPGLCPLPLVARRLRPCVVRPAAEAVSIDRIAPAAPPYARLMPGFFLNSLPSTIPISRCCFTVRITVPADEIARLNGLKLMAGSQSRPSSRPANVL